MRCFWQKLNQPTFIVIVKQVNLYVFQKTCHELIYLKKADRSFSESFFAYVRLYYIIKFKFNPFIKVIRSTPISPHFIQVITIQTPVIYIDTILCLNVGFLRYLNF